MDKPEKSTPIEQFSKAPAEGKGRYNYYTIKATPVKSGNGGTISPPGSLSIREGKDRTFTITPDKGYVIKDVKVDDKSIGPEKSYTFENVRENHTIEAIFDKIELTGTPTLSKDTITYGDALNTISLSGQLHDDSNQVDVHGTFEWKDGTLKPEANDSYQAEWKFTPEDTENYSEFTGTVTVKVNKALPTGESGYTKITTDNKTLADAALTTVGSTLNPNDGRLEWVDDKGNVLPDDTEVEADKIYRWRFTPVDANYKVLTGEVKLYHKHEGGGSSGGSSGSSGSGNSSGTSSRNRDWSRSDLPYYVVKDGKWFRDDSGRWFFSTDRTYTDEWAALINPYADTLRGQSGYDWFRFGKDSVMMTGWYTDANGDTFYLNPVSDNTLGRMFTGWHWIDDNKDGICECYYFREASDGRRGRLYKGTTTPDGYTVNKKGQWTIDGVVQTRK